MKICIVCNTNKIEIFKVIRGKTYWSCLNCKAKFLDKKDYVDLKTERGHYLKHNNFIQDKGYRNFLSQLSEPLKSYISSKDRGLDFGCGYGPALVDMLKSEGYDVEYYDPFFFPKNDIFLKKYHFITCTEVVEHFFKPFDEFQKLDNLLEEKGLLGIMTSFLTEDVLFEDWYYIRDPTHVVFYHQKTFQIIASQRNWSYEFPKKNIVFFRK